MSDNAKHLLIMSAMMHTMMTVFSLPMLHDGMYRWMILCLVLNGIIVFLWDLVCLLPDSLWRMSPPRGTTIFYPPGSSGGCRCRDDPFDNFAG